MSCEEGSGLKGHLRHLPSFDMLCILLFPISACGQNINSMLFNDLVLCVHVGVTGEYRGVHSQD